MFGFRNTNNEDGLPATMLLNQNSFYNAFMRDIARARNEVIIESPFITSKRIATILPVLRTLKRRNVKIIINTKPISEQEGVFHLHVSTCIEMLQDSGVEVLFTGGHHRKLAIIDRNILYEGSLNILSQNDSCEIMRRMVSEQLSNQMLRFTGLDRFIN